MTITKLQPAHLKYVTLIEKDLSERKAHNKVSIERMAGSLGIDNKNLVKELTELAIVRVAREIAQNTGLTNRERYDQIVDLYNHQANLSMRTSQSMMLQQYSTPAPIAFLAGFYILNSRVETPFYFEPSAGNGLLTIALPLKQTIVNEIDEIRNANLQTQGYFSVLSQNAIEPFRQFDKHGILGSSFDGIITNPPFGTLDKEVMYDEYKFKTLDHLMALRALDTMNDSGRAAIIIGGHTEWDKLGRIQAGKNWIFFNYLYHYYHVDDVINIDGHKLYSRQGTAFNVRLILISGRKEKPEGYAPLRQAKDQVVFTFDELWNRIAHFFLGSSTGASDPYSEIENAKARLRLLKNKIVMIQSGLGNPFTKTVINDTEWKKIHDEKKLVSKCEEHFRLNYQGRTIYNYSKGILIGLPMTGFDHTIHCNTWKYENLIIFKKLSEIIQNAKYINTGKRKENDSANVAGYYNFISKVVINGIHTNISIAIRIIKQRKKNSNNTYWRYYYNHFMIDEKTKTA